MNNFTKTLASFFLLILFYCCNSKRDSHIRSHATVDNFFLLKNELVTINKNLSEVAKIDTIISDMGCKRLCNYFNSNNKLIIQEHKILCLADLRKVCGVKYFFNEAGDTLVSFYIDGLGRAVSQIP